MAEKVTTSKATPIEDLMAREGEVQEGQRVIIRNQIFVLVHDDDDDDDFELTEAHRHELKRRVEASKANPGVGVPWPEAVKRLRAR